MRERTRNSSARVIVIADRVRSGIYLVRSARCIPMIYVVIRVRGRRVVHHRAARNTVHVGRRKIRAHCLIHIPVHGRHTHAARRHGFGRSLAIGLLLGLDGLRDLPVGDRVYRDLVHVGGTRRGQNAPYILINLEVFQG